MIKKHSILLVVLLFIAFIIPSQVQALSGLVINDVYDEVNFPEEISFYLSATSSVDITDIRLCYTVDRESIVDITSEIIVSFNPAAAIEINYSLEMLKVGGLPPGTMMSYWWKVQDSKGNLINSEPIYIKFDDNRYKWNSLTEDNLTMYWYQGSDVFIDELMASAQKALNRLDRYTSVRLEKQAVIYIYANSEDLKDSMIHPQEWTGGAAYPLYRIIAISVPPSSLSWGKDTIAHELTHLVVGQIVFNPYNGLPTWLEEGLAMFIEENNDPAIAAYMKRAIAENKLSSVRSLSSPFSAHAELAAVSYGQSQSLVEYLINTYGSSKMLELLTSFRQGVDYDEALEKVYGFNMDELDSYWRDNISDYVNKGG